MKNITGHLRTVLVPVIIIIFLLFTPTERAKASKPHSDLIIRASQSNPLASYVDGQIIIKTKPLRSAQNIRELSSAIILSVRNVPFGYQMMNIEGDVEAACDELMRNSDVIIAEPNYIRYLSLIPNDPKWAMQRNLNLSNAPLGWDIETGKNEVVVAVVDTGVDYNHTELAPNLLKGKNFKDFGDEMDDSGHGTAVCGVVGALGNNGVGVAGAAWNIRILPLRACGGPDLTCTVGDMVEAIEEAIIQDVDIINLSLGGFNESTIEREAMDAAWNAGIVLFAAVGNDGKLGKLNDPTLKEFITYPAGYTNVCGVSSIDYPAGANLANARLSSFSNYGDAVSVTAVGSQVTTTAPVVNVDYPIFGNLSGYGTINGTSFSTPLVSGLAALIKSHNPEMTNRDIRSRIESAVWDLSPDGWDDKFGYGLVDFQKALVGGLHSSNEAFNVGVTASPLLEDEVIIIVKAKVQLTNMPVVYFMVSGIKGVISSGVVKMNALPNNSTMWAGRVRVDKSAGVRFTVTGLTMSGPTPDLVIEYFKREH